MLTWTLPDAVESWGGGIDVTFVRVVVGLDGEHEKGPRGHESDCCCGRFNDENESSHLKPGSSLISIRVNTKEYTQSPGATLF